MSRNRLVGLSRNLALAVGTAQRLGREDPAVFILQLCRRLPVSVTGFAARTVLRIMPFRSTSAVALLADLLAGSESDLDRRLGLVVEGAIRRRRPVVGPGILRWAAEVAVAAGRKGRADAILARIPECAPERAALVGTVARRRWYDGDMSGAIAALHTVPRTASLAQRLSAERRVFAGWAPRLPSSPLVTPVRGRVLHLLTNSLPHTGSGYAQRSHSILLAQKQIGLDPLAVTRIGYPVQIGKVLAREQDAVDGITYQRLLPSRLGPAMDGRLQQQAEELLAVAHGFRPSVVHTTTDFTNGLVARTVARSLGVPFVYEVRGMLADTWASVRGQEARESERYRLFTAAEADLMRSADLVVTLGTAMRDRITAAGVPSDRVLLNPNAVGGPFLAKPVDPSAARARLGLADDGPLVGTVSSLVDYEGLEVMIEALPLLAAIHSRVKLLIVGSGAAEPRLRRRAADTGLGNRVIFTGRVPRDQAARYHQALDVFVVPRLDLAVTRTVTPLKPVEALASARPVVASDLPALREVVDDEVTGLLVPPGDPTALAAALSRLLADPLLRHRMGRAGREYALAHRTWEAGARAMAAAYEQVRGVTT